jgi:hypothetical protein
VYHGVPLYELLPTGSMASSPISVMHEDHVYLSMNGRHFDWRDESDYPYWAKKYFVKRDHLRVYYVFFGNDSATPDASTVATRRDAFRQKIGLRSTDVPLPDEPVRGPALTDRAIRESDVKRRLRTHQQLLLALASEGGWDRANPETVVRRSGQKQLNLPALLERYFGSEAVTDDTIRKTLRDALRDLQDEFDQVRR